MRKEYNFCQAKRNPHAKRLKRQLTIRLDADTVRYFKSLAGETGVPYKTLIKLYLRHCAGSGKGLSLNWKPAA